MYEKPIFVATHPRACSTALERVFMTRDDILNCIHEPFGDAFYFGPERLSTRYENDEKARITSGFSSSTYATILSRLENEKEEGKRLFIKDMASYLVPPDGNLTSIVPSLARVKRGIGTKADTASTTEDGGISNPTVVPRSLLKDFHFVFLIRHPRSAVPSYYRCTVPPLDEMTGFFNFMPNEMGYRELRLLFDYLRSSGQVGPNIKGQNGCPSDRQANGIDTWSPEIELCVIDADDLLGNPPEVIEKLCQTVGIDYTPKMLEWGAPEQQEHAHKAFDKWKGFHEDVLESTCLSARVHVKKAKSADQEDAEWVEKFGADGAKVIRDTVDANVADYEYLKQFAMPVMPLALK